jgi:hypothetical protein
VFAAVLERSGDSFSGRNRRSQPSVEHDGWATRCVLGWDRIECLKQRVIDPLLGLQVLPYDRMDWGLKLFNYIRESKAAAVDIAREPSVGNGSQPFALGIFEKN